MFGVYSKPVNPLGANNFQVSICVFTYMNMLVDIWMDLWVRWQIFLNVFEQKRGSFKSLYVLFMEWLFVITFVSSHSAGI